MVWGRPGRGFGGVFRAEGGNFAFEMRKKGEIAWNFGVFTGFLCLERAKPVNFGIRKWMA